MLILLLVKPLLAEERLGTLEQKGAPEQHGLLEEKPPAPTGAASSDPAGAAEQTTPKPLPVEDSGQWGWFIVGSTLIAGSLLVFNGLSIRCEGDTPCRRRASLSFWGGLGVASSGALLGLTVMQEGHQSASSHAELTLSGTF